MKRHSAWRRAAAAVSRSVSRLFAGSYSSAPVSSDRCAALFGWGKDASGQDIDEYTALNLSAVYCAVTLITGSMMSQPLVLYKRTGPRTKERAPDHPLYPLLHDAPNPHMTCATFIETMQLYALLWGNAYAEIERNGRGQPMALWPIHPSRVRVQLHTNGRERAYRVQSSGRPTVELDEYHMLHVHGLGFDGLTGLSPIAFARLSLGAASAAEVYGATFFGNSAVPSGLLMHPGQLDEEAQARLRASWQSSYGAENRHGTAILEEGMKYEKIGVPPEDAQFLETRYFGIEEVARWFNVPPHMLKDLRRATFSNIEHQRLEYFTDAILPWNRRWEQTIKLRLVSRSEPAILPGFVFQGLLRTDMPARYTSYAQGIQHGWLCADDVRELEDLNPLPDGRGQVYLRPVNMTPAMPPAPYNTIAAAAPDPAAIAALEAQAAELAFKRDVVKQLISDGTIGDVIFNLTDGRQLLQQVNLPIEAGAKPEPWLPVIADPGPLVSGEVVTDSQGDIVGGSILPPSVPSDPPPDETPPEDKAPEPDAASHTDDPPDAQEPSSVTNTTAQDPSTRAAILIAFSHVVTDTLSRFAANERTAIERAARRDATADQAALAAIAAEWRQAKHATLRAALTPAIVGMAAALMPRLTAALHGGQSLSDEHAAQHRAQSHMVHMWSAELADRWCQAAQLTDASLLLQWTHAALSDLVADVVLDQA